jgi:hypothetical protein
LSGRKTAYDRYAIEDGASEERWETGTVGCRLDVYTHLLEHVPCVRVAARRVTQHNEVVVDEWSHQTSFAAVT